MGAQHQTRERGFTLIELLVVISIIGLLASVVSASLGDARVQAREAKRKADLSQIALAIELYYSAYGDYPRTGGWCTQISNPWNNWGPDFQSDIAPWLSQVPLDPLYHNTSQDYTYWNIDDQSYNLYAELETEDIANDGIGACAWIGEPAGSQNIFDYRFPTPF